jgi:hypothetical protein
MVMIVAGPGVSLAVILAEGFQEAWKDLSFLLTSPCLQRTSGKMTDKSLRAFLASEVCPDHADMLLLICCLSSGLVDSTLYNGVSNFPTCLVYN